MSIKEHDALLDSHIDQETINKQSEYMDSVMSYGYGNEVFDSNSSSIQAEIHKLNELRAQVRQQENYIKRLQAEEQSKYDDYLHELLKQGTPMTIDPKTGKNVQLFPGLKEELEARHKQQEEQEKSKRLILGYTNTRIENGRIKSDPIYADNEPEPVKKTSLRNGEWVTE